jgi:hypothetical protein
MVQRSKSLTSHFSNIWQKAFLGCLLLFLDVKFAASERSISLCKPVFLLTFDVITVCIVTINSLQLLILPSDLFILLTPVDVVLIESLELLINHLIILVELVLDLVHAGVPRILIITTII